MFFVTSFSSQTRQIDSLIKLESVLVQDTQKVKLYGDICWELMSIDVAKSLIYAQKQLALAKKINQDQIVAQAESDLANVYNRKGEYENALAHYYIAVELRKKLKQPIKIAGIYSNIATVLSRQSKYEEAIEINFKSLKIFEEIGDENKQALTLGNIGTIYYELNQNKSAYSYFLQGLKFSRIVNNKSAEANSLLNIGGIKFDENDLDSALFYFYASKKILEENNLHYGLGNIYNTIGKVFAKRNNYESAIEFYEKGLKNRIEFEDEYGVGVSNLSIGEALLFQKKYSEAISHLEKSEIIFVKTHSLIKLKECYNTMSSALELKGDLVSSLKYNRLCSEIKDSLFTNQMAEQLLEMNAKYDSEKKEALLKLNELELEKQRLKSYYTTITFSITLLAIVITSLLLYFRYKSKQKLKFETEVNRQESLRYKTVIESLEKERNRISSELHDNTGAHISYIISKTDFILNSDLTDKEDLKNVKSSAQDVMTSLRETLWTLNNKSITNHDLIDKLKVYIKKYLLIPNKISDNSPNEYVLQNDAVLAIYRCVQEIINNINKHSEAKNVNIIFSSSENSKFNIALEDDGIGFTEVEKEESYGLRNLRFRLKEINAELNISSEKDKGTRIVINYN